jgi:hypothetical protein
VAHLPAQCAAGVSRKNSRGANVLELSEMLAGSTGLEPAASGVTVFSRFAQPPATQRVPAGATLGCHADAGAIRMVGALSDGFGHVK